MALNLKNVFTLLNYQFLLKYQTYIQCLHFLYNIGPSHKSQSALNKYLTMPHFITEIYTRALYITKGCIMEHGTGICEL